MRLSWLANFLWLKKGHTWGRDSQVVVLRSMKERGAGMSATCRKKGKKSSVYPEELYSEFVSIPFNALHRWKDRKGWMDDFGEATRLTWPNNAIINYSFSSTRYNPISLSINSFGNSVHGIKEFLLERICRLTGSFVCSSLSFFHLRIQLFGNTY